MTNPVPYLRQRSDSYWEIVYVDESGKTRRSSTSTKNEAKAQKELDEFIQGGERESDPDAPRLRQRTDGIWETRWTDEAGAARRHSHSTRDQEDARIAHDRFVKELAKPEIPTRPTVAWIIDDYYDFICRERSENTSGPMAANVKPLKDHLGHMFWDEVIQETVDDYITWRMKQPRWTAHQDYEGQYGTASRNTACKDLRVLRAAMRRAKKNRYTTSNPDFEIVEGDPVRDTKTWITMEEMERMIEACQDQPVIVNGKETDRIRDRSQIYGFLLIALASGARKEAILSLTWDQVYIPAPTSVGRAEIAPEPVLDPDGNYVMPQRSFRKTMENPPIDYKSGQVVSGAYIDFGAGSGNKHRPQIPVGQNPRLMEYLLFGGDRSQPFVISYKGKPVDSIKKGLKEVAKDAGIKKAVTHHTMKRTAITHMVRAGIPLEIIADAVNTTVAILKKHYNMHRPDVEKAFGGSLSIR